MLGVSQFLEDFQPTGAKILGPCPGGPENQFDFVVFEDFRILAGRFAGSMLDLAILVPKDYPLSPPGGFYINSAIIPAGFLNVHLRREEVAGLPVGPAGTWLYWSRPITNRWRQSNRPQVFLAHWQSAFADPGVDNVQIPA